MRSDDKPIIEVLPANIIPQQDGIKKHIILEKSGNSMIKQETIEYTLNNNNINNNFDVFNTHFYRGNNFNINDMINIEDLTNKCATLECELCKKSTPFQCTKCVRGHFLFNNICYTVCPDNHIADVFRRRCIPLNNTSKVVFIMTI